MDNQPERMRDFGHRIEVRPAPQSPSPTTMARTHARTHATAPQSINSGVDLQGVTRNITSPQSASLHHLPRMHSFDRRDGGSSRLLAAPPATRAGGVLPQVFWEGDGAWYRGTVSGYSAATQRHTVLYDDNDLERVVLDAVPHRRATAASMQETHCLLAVIVITVCFYL